MKILKLELKMASMLALLAGGVVALLVGLYAWQIQERERRAKFSSELEVRANLFKSELARTLDVLNDVSAMVNVHGEPTRLQFNRFASDAKILDRYDGVYGITYSPVMKREDVPIYVEAVRNDRSLNKQGYPDFHMIGPPESLVKKLDKLDIHPLVAIATYYEPQNEYIKNHMKDTYGRDLLAIYPDADYNAVMKERTDRIFSTTYPIPIPGFSWSDAFTLRRFIYSNHMTPNTPTGLVLFFLSVSKLMNSFADDKEVIARLWYVGKITRSPLPRSDSKPSLWFDTEWKYGRKTLPDKPSSYMETKHISVEGLDFDIQGIFNPVRSMWDYLVPAMASMLVFSAVLILLLTLKSQRRARQEAVQLNNYLNNERRLSDEMRGMLAHMARLNLSREMAGSLSHELRQPLAVIRSYCSVGQQSLRKMAHKDEILEEVLEGCEAAAKRATTLVERWRDFVVSKRQQIDFPLNLALKEATSLMEPRCRSLFTTLTWKGDWNVQVYGDPIMLGQVWINLIQNSLDAIEIRGIAVGEIECHCSVVDQMLKLQIYDNGGGMSESLMSSVFEPFITDKPNGTGLGLAICRSIIRGMGGEISLMNVKAGVLAVLDLPRA